MSDYMGCGDHGCLVQKPEGQGTNGGCRCFVGIEPYAKREYMMWEWALMQWMIRRLTTALEDIERVSGIAMETDDPVRITARAEVARSKRRDTR
jgi:hypothetical protein